mmetsp:Transcript_16586/g.27416  ORF Transcript_16586/g.27416 Transcript_16586/m.27416 type:complete len:156 (-) Transcript_16586:618-1085(-)
MYRLQLSVVGVGMLRLIVKDGILLDGLGDDVKEEVIPVGLKVDGALKETVTERRSDDLERVGVELKRRVVGDGLRRIGDGEFGETVANGLTVAERDIERVGIELTRRVVGDGVKRICDGEAVANGLTGRSGGGVARLAGLMHMPAIAALLAEATN